jgi:UDP-N-acetylenolpyruvoylglucosamine reductase
MDPRVYLAAPPRSACRAPPEAAPPSFTMNTLPAPAPAAEAPQAAAFRLASVLKARLSPEAVVRTDEPLARRTTLRVGGCADVLVEPAGEEDLALVLSEARNLGVPWRVLGRGSNLLVRDGGLRGLVICLAHAAFGRIEGSGSWLRCGAGARLKDVAAEARRRALAGLEFLSGIPGSVGGALRMNAGAWNTATFERLESIRYMAPDGTVRECPAAEVPAAYRRCELFRDHLALAAVFRGEPSTREAVEERLNDLNRRRWASQPAAPSAGCIFKNPAAIPAGRLIDELGLKGTRIGGAAVSTVHGNFIVNEGEATAADVLALIEFIRRTAREARGIELETEVEIVGE